MKHAIAANPVADRLIRCTNVCLSCKAKHCAKRLVQGACLESLHRAPDRVQDPLLEGILHAHDFGATQQEVKLLLLQLPILLQDGHAELSGYNQLVAFK